MFRNEAGYSLIEMLIVLSIFSILLILPMTTFSSINKSYTHEYIAWQFKQDLMMAQHAAMTHGRITTVRINNSERTYTIRFSAFDPYVTRPFQNDDMRFQFISLGDSAISFLPPETLVVQGRSRLSSMMSRITLHFI